MGVGLTKRVWFSFSWSMSCGLLLIHCLEPGLTGSWEGVLGRLHREVGISLKKCVLSVYVE